MSKEESVKQILSRGVTNIIEKKHLYGALNSRVKLRIKYGIDPTGPKVHLGHAITFWKLRELQDLGHKIVLIIGDYTAWIGDPSDKESERQPLTKTEVEKNKKDYLEQIGLVVNLKKAEIHNNSEWHERGTKRDLLEEAMNFTVNQMSQRDNFSKRLAEEKPVGLHEFLYPLLQGMDSVATKSDVEIGGNDQYFNLLAGRTLQKKYGQKPQDVLTLDLIEGTDGRKMSKSYDNAIYLLDPPKEKFGKVMSINDDLIMRYFLLCTDVSEKEIKKIEKGLAGGKNPRDAKAKLAYEIVRRYHGEEEAKKAQDNFEKQFVKKEVPDEIPVVRLRQATMYLRDILVDTKLAPSKNEARRLLEQGGVKVDGAKIGDREAVIEPHSGMIIQVGKRKFIRVK